MKNLIKLIVSNQDKCILIISIICLVISLLFVFDLNIEDNNWSKYYILGVASLWVFNFYFLKQLINKYGNYNDTPWEHDYGLLVVIIPFLLFSLTVFIRSKELIQYFIGIMAIVLYIATLVSIISGILKDKKYI